MTPPTTGSEYERRLEERLWNEGFASFRVAGSGTIGHASADVVGIRSGRTLIFEVKSTKPGGFPIDVSEDRKQLKELAERVRATNAKVYFAVYVKNRQVWGYSEWDQNEIGMSDMGKLYEVLL